MKREDQLRATALDMAIRSQMHGETASTTTARALAFLVFLNGKATAKRKR